MALVPLRISSVDCLTWLHQLLNIVEHCYRSDMPCINLPICNNKTNYLSKKSLPQLPTWLQLQICCPQNVEAQNITCKYTIAAHSKWRVDKKIRYQTQFTEYSNYSNARQEHSLEIKSYSCLQRSVFWFYWIYKTKGLCKSLWIVESLKSTGFWRKVFA